MRKYKGYKSRSYRVELELRRSNVISWKLYSNSIQRFVRLYGNLVIWVKPEDVWIEIRRSLSFSEVPLTIVWHWAMGQSEDVSFTFFLLITFYFSFHCVVLSSEFWISWLVFRLIAVFLSTYTHTHTNTCFSITIFLCGIIVSITLKFSYEATLWIFQKAKL